MGTVKFKNQHHIETIPALPLENKDGVFMYPHPHDVYIRKAEEIIVDNTSSIDCFLWVVYFARSNEFKIHDLKSRKIFIGFSVEIEKKIKKAIELIRNEQLAN